MFGLYESAFGALTWGNLVMFIIGALLIYLGIAKKMEPGLLVPIGFGIFLVNLPYAGMMMYTPKGFPADHPYGQPYTGSGTEESINALTRQDLIDYYEANYLPNNAAVPALLVLLLGCTPGGEIPMGPGACEVPAFVGYDSEQEALTWDLSLEPDYALIDAGDPEISDPDGSRRDIGAYGGPYGGG